MASPKHTLPSSGISDVTKLSSRKRNEQEDEDETEEYNNEQSNTKKKARESVASIPEPEPGSELIHTLEPPASFNTLDDDCLGNVLDFVGKKCYSAFGRVNKRCHEMFCSKGLPKETYLFGYAPLRLIQQRREEGWYDGIAKGVLHFNRRDVFEWMMTSERYDEIEIGDGYDRLKYLCDEAIHESRADILHEVFRRTMDWQKLDYLSDSDGNIPFLTTTASALGELECLEVLTYHECFRDQEAWIWAKRNGHEHILEYLRNNGYPTEWQDDSVSEYESDSEDNSD